MRSVEIGRQVTLVAKVPTVLKKYPFPIEELFLEDYADVLASSRLPCTRIKAHSDQHTLISNGLGKWWVQDADWLVEEDILTEKPYRESDGLRYLSRFPYRHLPLEAAHDFRKAQMHSLVSCLLYLEIGEIACYEDYLKAVHKHGDGTAKRHNKAALRDLGVKFTYSESIAPEDLEAEIDQGRPVVVAIVSEGSWLSPYGMTYFVVVFGYSKDNWLVHDPCGALDLRNGKWLSTVEGAGQSIKYSRKDTDRRIFYGGGASAWAWLRFEQK